MPFHMWPSFVVPLHCKVLSPAIWAGNHCQRTIKPLMELKIIVCNMHCYGRETLLTISVATSIQNIKISISLPSHCFPCQRKLTTALRKQTSLQTNLLRHLFPFQTASLANLQITKTLASWLPKHSECTTFGD